MMKNYPPQPVIMSRGALRFLENRLVAKLLDMASRGRKFDLNDAAIWCKEAKVSRAEQMQFAMLIGYSVSGFGDLPYATRPAIAEADRQARKLSRKLKL